MRMRAIWRGAVLAESDQTVVVEGNHYFPRESLTEDYFKPSWTRSVCLWKGVASYYTVTVDGERNRDAAWEYRRPFPAARQVKGRVAFWHGVEVVAVDDVESGTVAR